MTRREVHGKVAKVIDCYTVAITCGSESGAQVGDIMAIADHEIIDPETGGSLGFLPGVRVKVTEVYPRFCVASTYRLVPPRPPLSQILDGAEWSGDPSPVVVNVGDHAMRVAAHEDEAGD